MPEAGNLTLLPFVIHSIHNSVRTENDFAKVLVFVFGNYATELGKGLKTVSLGNQLVSERHCALGIIARDENDDVMEVVAGSGRALPQKSAKPTNDNSPPIHRWGWVGEIEHSP